MAEYVEVTQKLLEYDDNSYYALDYSGALQTLNNTLNHIAINQQYIIVFLACLCALLMVLTFAFAFKHKNY